MNFPRNPKVILLGDISVGKTAIIHTLVNEEFPQKLVSTMGACFQRYQCQLQNGKTVPIDIWDTAGQQKYRSLLVMYYKNCDVIIMVFDVTRQESFDTVEYWSSQINQHCPKKPYVILVGNKYDLKDKQKIINQAKVKGYAQSKGWYFYYASALMKYNIKQIFQKAGALALQMLAKNQKKQKQKNSPIKVSQRKNRQRNSCC